MPQGGEREWVQISEEVEHPRGDLIGEAPIWTGRFTAVHRRGTASIAELEHAHADEAVTWARQRHETIVVHLGDGTPYAAGTGSVGTEIARWPPREPVRRRRMAGYEWQDRTDADQAISWSVEIDLLPLSPAPPDLEARVDQLARGIGAQRWERHAIEPAQLGIVDLTPAPDGRVGLLDDQAGDGPEELLLVRYRLFVVVRASTVRAALEDVLRTCRAPNAWMTTAFACPADTG